MCQARGSRDRGASMRAKQLFSHQLLGGEQPGKIFMGHNVAYTWWANQKRRRRSVQPGMRCDLKRTSEAAPILRLGWVRALSVCSRPSLCCLTHGASGRACVFCYRLRFHAHAYSCVSTPRFSGSCLPVCLSHGVCFCFWYWLSHSPSDRPHLSSPCVFSWRPASEALRSSGGTLFHDRRQ